MVVWELIGNKIIKTRRHIHTLDRYTTRSPSRVYVRISYSPSGWFRERKVKKNGGRNREGGGSQGIRIQSPSSSVDDGGGGEEELKVREGGAAAAGPRLSSLVVVGRVGKGKLQPVSFCQEHADLLVTPVHRGKVLQEDHQPLLRNTEHRRIRKWEKYVCCLYRWDHQGALEGSKNWMDFKKKKRNQIIFYNHLLLKLGQYKQWGGAPMRGVKTIRK